MSMIPSNTDNAMFLLMGIIIGFAMGVIYYHFYKKGKEVIR